MQTTPASKLPLWFWIVAGVALVWNLIGIAAFFMDPTMNESAMAALPEAQRSLYAATPAWATAAFAIAVFGGAAASAGLLLRTRLAVALFGISLVAVLVQMFQAFVLANAISVVGAGAAIMPAIITLIAIALLWFAWTARSKGWLR
jgi:hypothetical protein